MMLKKVTIKKIKKNEVLYLKGDEAAIMLSGNLHLVSYDKDVIVPYVARMYTQGDVIGLPEIDGGWCSAETSWIIAWEDCDMFFVSRDYLRYMWD